MIQPSKNQPAVLSSGSLNGNDVKNTTGESLGDIKDMMIDIDQGRVAYAVLSFGGVLGLGDKLFAIPWEALRLDTDDKCFILDVPKDKLEKAPGFNKDNWPNMADRKWATDIHTHYGYKPYWS